MSIKDSCLSIKAVIFDIDGVLTDGMVHIDQNGNESKRLCMTDIDAVYDIKRNGFIIGAITGEDTPVVKYFQNRFPWDYFIPGCKDKLIALKKIETEAQLTKEEICYIGDGYYDIPALNYAGLSVCPANAIPEAAEAADICLSRCGGGSCIWELRCLLLDGMRKS